MPFTVGFCGSGATYAIVLLSGDHAGCVPTIGWLMGPSFSWWSRQHVSICLFSLLRLVVQMCGGFPGTVRSNAILPPEGEKAGCSESPASFAVRLMGLGRPPPGGYRSITNRSQGPPL